MKCFATRSAATIIFILCMARGSVADDKGSPADVKALQAHNEAFVAAFDKGDVKAMAEAYAPDTDFLSAEGRRVKGRAELERYFAKGFVENKGLRLKHTDSSVRFLTAEVAVADGTWEITGRAEGRAAKGHYTASIIKRDGQWLIAYDRPMVPLRTAQD